MTVIERQGQLCSWLSLALLAWDMSCVPALSSAQGDKGVEHTEHRHQT